MNIHESSHFNGDHDYLMESGEFSYEESNDFYTNDSDAHTSPDTSNPYDSNPYDSESSLYQESQNLYEVNPYPDPYINPHIHHQTPYSDDLISLERVGHQRSGSEMNPYEKANYYRNDEIMYTDKNGVEHKGLILETSYNGECSEFKVQRADGTLTTDNIGKADIKGVV